VWRYFGAGLKFEQGHFHGPLTGGKVAQCDILKNGRFEPACWARGGEGWTIRMAAASMAAITERECGVAPDMALSPVMQPPPGRAAVDGRGSGTFRIPTAFRVQRRS
jgi:hypothetical protein